MLLLVALLTCQQAQILIANIQLNRTLNEQQKKELISEVLNFTEKKCIFQKK
jgi:hypothetical protein